MRLLLASPFLPPFYDGLLTERKSVLELLKTSGDLAWCEDMVAVRLNGITVPRVWWPYVTVKPDAAGTLELCIVPQKGNLLPILASVALVGLTAGIGAFGVPFLGAGFAAGTFGASAVAAGVGIAGQLAINALTAPPSAPKGPGAQRDLSQAGISQNQITLFETLPTLHGRMRVSPPVLAPAYTTFDKDQLTVHAIVGIEGRNEIDPDEILVNGTNITLLEGCEYETREGGPGDAALTLAQLTVIQDNDQRALEQFTTQLETSKNDVLIDQDTPANSSPKWQYFTTAGIVDEFWIRHVFPSGIVNTVTPEAGAVAVRYDLRKKGDVAWRNGPTLHFWDERKGNGPLRVEVKFKFKRMGDGPHYNPMLLTEGYPVFAGSYVTGSGQSFAYTSDAYFAPGSGGTELLPAMSAPTTSGVTMSASSESGAQNAWKAGDAVTATYWQPTNNTLPNWIKVDFGATQIVKSYQMRAVAGGGSDTSFPSKGYLEGSNDDATWTLLSTYNQASGIVRPFLIGWVEEPAAYRYYRWTNTANQGAASQQIRIGEIGLHDDDHNPVSYASGTSGGLAFGISLTENGAEIYLDPDDWDAGVYEVRVKRSYAFNAADLVVSAATTYTYNANAAHADFFDYFTSSSLSVIRIGQKNYRSDMNVETFSSVSNDVPVDTTGIACIAVEIKNTVIDSISAVMTSYASEFDGTIWAETEVPTSNPAALYRKLLLGHAHPNPSPAEIINEDELAAWFTRCVTAGHECNFLQQGRSIAEVKQVIASTGYASPRESNLLSVVEDYDRSAEPVTQTLSPLNSKLLGVNIPLPDLEHAIYAEYFDAADDWKIARDIFYRDGFDANSATFFGTVTYDGFTAAAKVAARAAFDLKQVVLRARRVRREIGIEGYSLWRGKLVAHNDDVLNTTQAQGLIRSLEVVAGNVVSMTVDNIIPFSVNQDELAAFVEGLDLANATGVAIRLNDGSSIVKTLTNVSDGTICTFTTPFPLSDLGITLAAEAKDFMAVFGRAGQTHERMIVMGVEPQGLETRIVTLAAAGDAALFA